MKVEALLKESKTNEKLQKSQKKEIERMRLALEGPKVKQLIQDAGFRFTQKCSYT